MNVEESMHVVFDETNPKLQDDVPKIADEEEIALEKKYATKLESVAGNQSVEKEIDIAVVRRSNYHYFSNFSIASL